MYRALLLCCLPHVPLAKLLQLLCCSEACMQWRLDKTMNIRKTNMVTRSTCNVIDSQNQIIFVAYFVTLIPARHLSCTDTPYQGSYITVLSTICAKLNTLIAVAANEHNQLKGALDMQHFSHGPTGHGRQCRHSESGAAVAGLYRQCCPALLSFFLELNCYIFVVASLSLCFACLMQYRLL